MHFQITVCKCYYLFHCLSDFSTLIQTLSRRGIYVTDYDGNAVTESILVQTAPFKVVSL